MFEIFSKIQSNTQKVNQYGECYWQNDKNKQNEAKALAFSAFFLDRSCRHRINFYLHMLLLIWFIFVFYLAIDIIRFVWICSF